MIKHTSTSQQDRQEQSLHQKKLPPTLVGEGILLDERMMPEKVRYQLAKDEKLTDEKKMNAEKEACQDNDPVPSPDT